MRSHDAPTTLKFNVINFKLDSGASDYLVNVKTFFDVVKKLPCPVVINVANDGAVLVANEEGVIYGMVAP